MLEKVPGITQNDINPLPHDTQGILHTPLAHESAHKHVSGRANYIDDLPEQENTLHLALGLSSEAHARILACDLTAVRKADGVVGVLSADDIPGRNDISPTHRHDEPVFATDDVQYHGQPLFAVVATTREAARRAARLANITYEPLPVVLDIASARDKGGKLVTEPLILSRGDAAIALANAPHRLQGAMTIGGQDHFYLEGQIALAIPSEDGDVTVYASTQHPSEVQHMVAQVLGVPLHAVSVDVRRMGGAFGGKETQGNLFAVVAALAAKKFHRAAKIRPDRDDDMIITGKRHDFVVNYDVGFDANGRILGLDFIYAARCGYSADLSGPITDRALFHCDNCYYYPAVHARSEPLYTNTVSNTAFRGFGGPQGMLGAERVIDEIAFALGKDPLEIRQRNFYSDETGRITPYHQIIEDNIIARLVDELATKTNYHARKRMLGEQNASSKILKYGLALTPVKFGISFTATWYNQAGALLHLYTDGSLMVNHGGTEMGQGLYTKITQVVAQEFCVDVCNIKVTATRTDKVPNTSATAASSGADLNGMAVQNAARTLKERLIDFASAHWQVGKDEIVFAGDGVHIGTHILTLQALAKAAYMARVQLSATGFYKTPEIFWDRQKGQGQPFYYFAYGAAVSEVVVDTLTGEYRVTRVDILHDVGNSLNPALDKGQIEGGFIQGQGWLTTEELWFDDKGRLCTHAPATYKIPLASDRAEIFTINTVSWALQDKPTIGRSKAVGEPPLMLAISVLHALSDAVASVADYKFAPKLDAPATPERVLFTIERLRAQALEDATNIKVTS